MPTIVNSYFATIVGYLYGFDFLIGASSNLFGVWIILNSKELRNKTYFLILSCFFLANVLVACSVSLPAFLNTVLKSDLEFDSLIWCKMSLFLYAFSMQFSSWIITYLSLETSLSVKTIGKKFSDKKWALGIVISIGLTLTLANIPLLIYNGYEETINGTIYVTCYESKINPSFLKIGSILNALLNSILPSMVIIATCVYLARGMMLSKNKIKHSVSGSRINDRDKNESVLVKKLVNFSISFVLLTLPRAIAIILTVYEFASWSYLTFKVLEIISIQSYSTSFVQIIFSNRLLKIECLLIFNRIRNFFKKS